jgi:hypothetical protein
MMRARFRAPISFIRARLRELVEEEWPVGAATCGRPLAVGSREATNTPRYCGFN